MTSNHTRASTTILYSVRFRGEGYLPVAYWSANVQFDAAFAEEHSLGRHVRLQAPVQLVADIMHTPVDRGAYSPAPGSPG